MRVLFDLRKVANDMATVYATLIIKGKRTFKSVPEKLKAQVKEILIDLDCENLTVEE
ncbi:MAG: CD1375 family protein [Acutalibacteraceae bacterium]|nr:CD1375 family protein [Acutalibacteraceae bacterium]